MGIRKKFILMNTLVFCLLLNACLMTKSPNLYSLETSECEVIGSEINLLFLSVLSSLMDNNHKLTYINVKIDNTSSEEIGLNFNDFKLISESLFLELIEINSMDINTTFSINGKSSKEFNLLFRSLNSRMEEIISESNFKEQNLSLEGTLNKHQIKCILTPSMN